MKDPKQVVLEYVDAFNSGDIDRLCSLFKEDACIWGVLGWGTVVQARPVWQDLITCLQLHLELEAMVSEGKCVAVRYRETGKSVQAFRGQGPTGRTYELLALEWFEVQDGLISRRWGARDSATQNRQLGFTQDLVRGLRTGNHRGRC